MALTIEGSVVSLNLNEKLLPPTEDIEGLEGAALHGAVKAWFLSNFEDPANETPYNGREGGYQYIWGGPFDAREQIEGYFGDTLPEPVIDAVVEDLERDVIDWAPNGNRIYDEDPLDDEPDVAFENLQNSLDELVVELEKVDAVSAAIGGNNPPEEIGVPPYGEEERAKVSNAIETLRNPEVVASQRPAGVQAIEYLQTFRVKLIEFLKKQGGLFADGFSKKLGETAAVAVVGLGIWALIGERLGDVIRAAKTLLGAIS